MLKCLLFVLSSNCLVAQIQFQPMFMGSEFRLESWYALGDTDSVQVTSFKCYVSNFQVNGKATLKNSVENVFLLDAAEPSSLFIFPALSSSAESIRFDLGMDSSLNTCGVLAGPFDPLLGMYWAWNTGYIQLKISGTARLKGESIPFEYHVGGYRQPNATCERINIAAGRKSVQMDMQPFLMSLPYASQPKIMHPCAAAKTIHHTFATCFQ